MRKEMFDHEINILRDTYRRLLRRNAKINLIKLTNKTHPADLAVVFRHFSDEEQIEIFSLMKESEHTAEFLSELDDALVNELLENESYERIAAIIEKAPTNDQSGILNILDNEKRVQLRLEHMKKKGKVKKNHKSDIWPTEASKK